MRRNLDNPKFTASDARRAIGVTYRQLNDWDSKGALPRHRTRSSGWRKFDPRQFFVLLVCGEIRKRFGVPIEKLAWLQKFMLQDGADHFLAAVEMMRLGLAVVIFTDLSEQFEMDSDFAIGQSLSLGFCGDDKPQGYVLLLANPLINKILAALRNPMRLEISHKNYDALRNALAATRARDTAEAAVLETMRQPNTSKFTVEWTNDTEVVIEIDVKEGIDGTVQEAAEISRKVVKKVARLSL